jgi:hypothetical protein
MAQGGSTGVEGLETKCGPPFRAGRLEGGTSNARTWLPRAAPCHTRAFDRLLVAPARAPQRDQGRPGDRRRSRGLEREAELSRGSLGEQPVDLDHQAGDLAQMLGLGQAER